MKKLKIWTVLLVMALALSSCASPNMVKCPECQKVFDAQEHQAENYGR